MSSPSVRHPGEFRWETRLLAVVTLALTGFGIANCYAAGSYINKWYHEASQQTIAAIAGGAVFLVAAYTDYQLWRKLAKPLLLATVAGLAIIAIPALIWRHGAAPGPIETLFPRHLGARRWLRIGIQVQVSEIARFTLAAYLAARLADSSTKIRDLRKGFIPLMGIVLGTALLVAVEPSVTMSIVTAVIGVSVIFTAGARIAHLLLPALGGVAVVGAILVLDPVRAARYTNFSDSSLLCAKLDQVCQSLIGFGDGGMIGVGFGRGSQKLGHLPFSYSDFLLSVIGEEWGFFGVLFVALGFALFCWMGFRIAKTARDPFGTYLASGITVGIGISAFMHAAVVTNLMPATGLTLPFMSAGRVSLVLCLFSAGVLVSIGRRRGRPARER